MSKTSQRKRQAYQEGLKHGLWRSGIAYTRHPFMAEYRRGYSEGVARAKYRDQFKAQQKSGSGIAKILGWMARSAA